MSYLRHNRLKPLPGWVAAFTLIELLVVISIIALIMAILLPALRTARNTAQMTVSVSNARQQSLALFSYAADNQEYLPYSRFARAGQDFNVDPTPNGAYWQGVLYHGGYASSLEVFFSPGHDKGPFTNPEFLVTNPEWFEWRYTDYSPNFVGAMPWQWWGGNPGYSPHRLGVDPPSPSQHLLLLEAVDSAFFGVAPSLPGTGVTPFTYRGGLPRSYMDGHATADLSTDVGWDGIDQFAGVPTISVLLGEPWYSMLFPDMW